MLSLPKHLAGGVRSIWATRRHSLTPYYPGNSVPFNDPNESFKGCNESVSTHSDQMVSPPHRYPRALVAKQQERS